MSTDKRDRNLEPNASVYSVKSVVKLFSHYESAATQITATQTFKRGRSSRCLCEGADAE
jgi:hypothetical protein